MLAVQVYCNALEDRFIARVRSVEKNLKEFISFSTKRGFFVLIKDREFRTVQQYLFSAVILLGQRHLGHKIFRWQEV